MTGPYRPQPCERCHALAVRVAQLEEELRRAQRPEAHAAADLFDEEPVTTRAERRAQRVRERKIRRVARALARTFGSYVLSPGGGP